MTSSDFFGRGVNEGMSLKNNSEAIFNRVNNILWDILSSVNVEKTDEQLTELHNDLLDSMLSEFKNKEGLSMGIQAENIFYEIGSDENHPDNKEFLSFAMLSVAQMACLYAIDALSTQDTVKQVNYIGRAWFYTGMLTADRTSRQEFELQKSEKMREMVTNRHKNEAAKKEAIRLKVIEQWEKGNPNTGAGWPTIEAATTYLVAYIDKPYSTIRSWISAHEKSKRTKEDV